MESQTIYRILITINENLVLNMIYKEYKNEIFGSVIGEEGSGGCFYFNSEQESFFSDDFFEFDTSLDFENLEDLFNSLENKRAEFEEYDDAGDLLGLSSLGLKKLQNVIEDSDGMKIYLSNDASLDYIYDIQDEWNISFFLN